MRIRRISYLVLVMSGGFLVMLYNFRGLRYLLCCMILVPLVSFLLALPGKFLCRVELETAQNDAVRENGARFIVKVKSGGMFHIMKLRLDLCWEVPGGRAMRKRHWLCGIGRQREEAFPLELPAEHCGMATLSIRKAAICDYLGLFALSLPKGKREEICIMPVIRPVSVQVQEVCSTRSTGVGTEREGDLLLRDFLPGDSVHRVYWKLAAKDGELQVRDFERSGVVTLYLNFSDRLSQQAENWDRYLDRACSLLYFLSEEGQQILHIAPEVIWRKGELYLKSEIQNGEAALAWTAALLKGKVAGILLTEEEKLSLDDGWCLEEDGGLYFGGRLVQEQYVDGSSRGF